MALALTDEDLRQMLDTYNGALFAEQCPTNTANADALRKLVAEAGERGLDISEFKELGFLTGDAPTPTR